jgi:NADPH:quinone reductase-like Zn-dependent oxidoreductase
MLKTLMETAVIKPVIDRQYDLDQIAEAHRYVDKGRKKTNVVIRIKQQADIALKTERHDQ